MVEKTVFDLFAIADSIAELRRPSDQTAPDCPPRR